MGQLVFVAASVKAFVAESLHLLMHLVCALCVQDFAPGTSGKMVTMGLYIRDLVLELVSPATPVFNQRDVASTSKLATVVMGCAALLICLQQSLCCYNPPLWSGTEERDSRKRIKRSCV